MKEKIYTISISEAFEQDSFCPFCYLHKRLEEESVKYTLGPAMMEPDFRMVTNEKGFCKTHMRELNGERNALSLALVMDTHIAALMDLFESKLKSEKKSVFKRKKEKENDFISRLKQVSQTCAICSRVENTFSQYVDTFVFMLKKEEGFLDKVLSSEGFCMEHFARLAEVAERDMSSADFEKYFEPIIKLQKNRLEKHHQYIQKFEESFDYRNAGKKTDVPKDILLTTGKLLNGEFEPKEK